MGVPGYEYATLTGYWPTPDGRFVIHCKMGSTRAKDPVYELTKYRYKAALGHPFILAIEPTADAFRDEFYAMHPHFADRRVWDDSEIFWFHSVDEFHELFAAFLIGLRQDTLHEEKPAIITDLVNPLPSTLADINRYREDKRRTRAARKQAKKEEQARARQELQRKRLEEKTKKEEEARLQKQADRLAVLARGETVMPDFISQNVTRQPSGYVRLPDLWRRFKAMGMWRRGHKMKVFYDLALKHMCDGTHNPCHTTRNGVNLENYVDGYCLTRVASDSSDT